MMKVIPKLEINPNPVFSFTNIPTKPKSSIGSRQYPRILIMLYSEIVPFFVLIQNYPSHEVEQEKHKKIAEDEHRINVTKMKFS